MVYQTAGDHVPKCKTLVYHRLFTHKVCFISFTDALNNFDGGNRAVEGATATAGIWATYPQTFVSTWNSLGDQVLV